jgi:hypothetical protein
MSELLDGVQLVGTHGPDLLAPIADKIRVRCLRRDVGQRFGWWRREEAQLRSEYRRPRLNGAREFAERLRVVGVQLGRRHPDPLELLKRVDLADRIARAFADQGDSEGGSQPYNAVRTAAGAAAALSVKIEDERKTISDKFSFVSILVQLVVVDAPLFRYTVSATGEQKLEAIPWIRVLAPVPGRSGSVYVIIVSLEALAEFLADVTEDVRTLSRAVVPRIEEIIRFHEIRERVNREGAAPG